MDPANTTPLTAVTGPFTDAPRSGIVIAGSAICQRIAPVAGSSPRGDCLPRVRAVSAEGKRCPGLVVDADVDARAICCGAPLNAAEMAGRAHAGVPDLRARVRVERPVHAALLASADKVLEDAVDGRGEEVGARAKV